MFGRERLIIGTKWMLENVRQENIRMSIYLSLCGTAGCWAGWMGVCPALNAEGYKLFGVWPCVAGQEQRFGHRSKGFLAFFNLTDEQAIFLFGSDQSGDKRDILARLHTVLLQPGPFDEPEIANLDAEWAALQQALEGVMR